MPNGLFQNVGFILQLTAYSKKFEHALGIGRFWQIMCGSGRWFSQLTHDPEKTRGKNHRSSTVHKSKGRNNKMALVCVIGVCNW